MKFNLKDISNLASSLPDVIAKGQKVAETIQNVSSSLKKGKDGKGRDIKGAVTTITSTIAEFKSQEESSKELTEKKQKEETVDVIAAEEVEEVKEQDNGTIIQQNMEVLACGPDVVSAIDTLIKQANETIQFCEEQETLRTEIRANADVEITKINATANLIRDYLNRSFDERAGLFDNYFNIVDKALENGDNNLLAQTLQSINALAASSPFKDLADLNKVSATLSEGGEWDI